MEIPAEIQSEETNIKTYAFSLPGGDRLVALWTDNVAMDEDPGFLSIVTLPGFEGWGATGIDILNSFEQELISSIGNGNLIIRDLLIKDYPIIIQLSK